MKDVLNQENQIFAVANTEIHGRLYRSKRVTNVRMQRKMYIFPIKLHKSNNFGGYIQLNPKKNLVKTSAINI